MLTQSTPPLLTPAEARLAIRGDGLRVNTSGMCAGFVQCNLVIVDQSDALDFLRFCIRNPRACPVVEVTDTGSRHPSGVAADADIATDLARYRVWDRSGDFEEVTDIRDRWTDNLVSFLLGCSYSFEHVLIDAGIPMRHHEQGVDGAPMYITNIACRATELFAGPQVVTMRPIPRERIDQVIKICAQLPLAHGAPIHVGDPSEIGIDSLDVPDWGDPVRSNYDDIPVFWACGVTSQLVAQRASVGTLITHAPGYMFITDSVINSVIV